MPACLQALAACDLIEDRLQRARSAGLAVYTDFRELLARDDLDAVVVATPTQWKPLHTIAAAKAGKDVFCEKPMTLCVEDGRAMVTAGNRNEMGRFEGLAGQQISREVRANAERYATAQELADDLQRFLDDKPIRARRPTLMQRAVKWSES